MSRTKHGSKGVGFEFWGRRSHPMSSGAISKRITKKQERTRNKKIINQAHNDPDNTEGRFAGE